MDLYEPWDSYRDIDYESETSETKNEIKSFVMLKNERINDLKPKEFKYKGPYSLRSITRAREKFVKLFKPLSPSKNKFHHSFEAIKIKLQLSSKLENDELTLKRIKEKHNQHESFLNKILKLANQLPGSRVDEVTLKESKTEDKTKIEFLQEGEGGNLEFNDVKKSESKIETQQTDKIDENVKKVEKQDESQVDLKIEQPKHIDSYIILESDDEYEYREAPFDREIRELKEKIEKQCMLYNPQPNIIGYEGPYYLDNILIARQEIIKEFEYKLRFNDRMSWKLKIRFK